MQGVGGVPPPVQHSMLHDVTLTASQKCLCEHTFLLRGIISAGRIAMQFFTADASTHQRCVCAIDGLAKMSVQAHIFASWLNMLRDFALGKIIAASPLPRFCAAAQLTASRKCLCKHTFSLRGKICLGFCLGQNHSGFAASALLRGCAIDGLAKMSVQAHIFASW